MFPSFKDRQAVGKYAIEYNSDKYSSILCRPCCTTCFCGPAVCKEYTRICQSDLEDSVRCSFACPGITCGFCFCPCCFLCWLGVYGYFACKES